jgi:two-component system sensor histidine kinase KdpD
VADISTDKPIELVFLILSPAGNPPLQVKLLGAASRAAQSRPLLQALRSAETPDEVLRAIVNWEASIPRSLGA